MRDRAAGQRDFVHVAARGFHGLAHRFADFVRLAGCDPDLAFSIPHRNQCIEGETATTLHSLRDAVDRDDVLDHAVALAVASATVAPFTTAATAPAPTAPPPPPPPPPPPRPPAPPARP